MKPITTLAVLLSMLALGSLSAPAALAAFDGQGCGTNVEGGTIGTGYYAGAGGDCTAAGQDLNNDMGLSKPTCEGCPSGQIGCIAGTNIPDDSGIRWGNCTWDSGCGCYTKGARVNSPTSWDKTCSSCRPMQPHEPQQP